MPRPPSYPDGGPRGGGPWGAAPWADPDLERRPGPPPWARLWVPVVVSALVQLPTAIWAVRMVRPEPVLAVVVIGLALVGPLALIAARRLPGPVVAVVTAAAVAQLLIGVSDGPPPVALAFALIGAVVRGARLWAWVSLAAGWGTMLGIWAIAPRLGWTPFRILGTTLGLLVVLGIAEAIRTRRERAREYRAVAARRRLDAAEEERMRIARELHDVLAHSLSQINVQAGVGLHLAETQPQKASEALAAIKHTSKTALDDVRAVLGVLRAEDGAAPLAPQPGVDRIAGLVAGFEVPGTRIELVDALGDRAVPAPVGAAAYRIVQEALTNIARHGVGVTRVRVELAATDDGIRVEVRDDGRVDAFEPGRGLLGMRERVELLGGRFEAEAKGGFRVRAELPGTEPAAGEERA